MVVKTLTKQSFLSIKKTFKRFLSILAIVLLGVGFFTGIRQTSPNMEESVDEYFKKQNVYDINLMSTWGITKDEINILKEKAEAANKAKTDFLASVSHEIRTPLNVIIGLSESILESNISNTMYEDVKNINQAGEILLEIINNILDITKVEEGKMVLINEPYNLGEVIGELSNIVKVSLSEKPIKFNVTVKGNIPSKIMGDKVKVHQILLNLLTNAVKYTKKGSITLNIDSKIVGNKVLLTFKVIDTGIGIKKSDYDKLFKKFERLDQGNKNIEGTGLGLVITKQLLNLMNGKISFESTYQKGTTFTVELEQTIVDKKQLGDIKDYEITKKDVHERFDGSNYEVLLVDDNVLNLKVAEKLLKAYKLKVTCVNSGLECLNITKNHKFDLIKDVNFTNSYFAYVPTTELAPLPLYRRLKLDPYEMATTIISLIIEASDFPLKLTLEFEKDSVRYKRYVHLFDALNDIQDQLECYMALEGITMTRLAKQIGFPKYAYNNIFSRIIKFNDFKQLTDMVGAKIKITFTPQIIKTYSSCKLMFEKMLSNIDDMVFKNDQCKESIKYQLFCSIIREAPELAIVESLIELEQLRRSSNLALFNQKDVDIFEESKKKEADSK